MTTILAAAVVLDEGTKVSLSKSASRGRPLTAMAVFRAGASAYGGYSNAEVHALTYPPAADEVAAVAGIPLDAAQEVVAVFLDTTIE